MGNVEIPNWLEGLPLAPEFRPTDTEFADPIAYISKIEKEASNFGICKIIPPLPKPSKKYVFSNLNRSLLKCPEWDPDDSSLGVSNSLKTGVAGDSGSHGAVRAVFTTRHQELGQSVRKTKGAVQNPPPGVNRQVWQSGEVYTLEQFESKSKSFARSILGTVKDVSPLVIEAMFWKAASEKPIYVEYANDVPGSAFGESKGQHYYSHRRRRKRAYFNSRLDSTDCKQNKMNSIIDTQNDEIKGDSAESQADICLPTSRSAMTVSTSLSNEASQSSKEKISGSSDDMQGTAGWKLSNSPWNLQVIARSSGSLTRFMPDDIPGVTSPMIYIGMLFSWFAWHVEDHELHSLNFLHTGSSKTWYAVPGDYAFDFEEVIRSEGYGGNIDHLAALKLLGEKTTLISPEVVIASGIPCCRLIQNPGEFVVTFPRAYHVGFSHGFNCGEAANFGTPQWLRVAKEAAVRRATMNHLPMLSHQQLLYLLTMSFISRVPRTLLPGVRSSRLRDRQKEERELLVKQAFIEDMVQENKLLSILLGKEATKQVVLWNADLLPDSSKHSQLPDLASTTGTCMADTSYISSADKSSHYLLDEMTSFMENLTDSYFGCDDLPCHFQTDSGPLACVGCGILGFPFMAVIQPTQKVIMELIPDSHHLVQDSSLNSTASLHCSVSRDISVSELSSAKDSTNQSLNKCNKCWDTSGKFFRPRIFCLEHAVQIVEMLQSKGGASVLIICHTDYQKIKTHSREVAEEIHRAFEYNEISLDIASPENLALIDLAIGGEEHNECEDWTSKLGINLQYCVNARNNSPSKHVPWTLALGTLFSDKRPGSEFSSLNWQSQRTRSKRSNRLAQTKPSDSSQRKKDDQLEGRVDGSTTEKKLIQYSRRRFKSKQRISNDMPLEETTEEKINTLSERDEEPLSDDKPNGEVCEVPRELYAAADLHDSVILDVEQCQIQNNNRINEESTSGYVARGDNRSETVSEQGCSEVSVETCPKEESCVQFSSDKEKEMENQPANRTDEELCPVAETALKDSSVSIQECSQNEKTMSGGENFNESEVHLSQENRELESCELTTAVPRSNAGKKRKMQVEETTKNQLDYHNFIRSPCEGLRPRAGKNATAKSGVNISQNDEENPVAKRTRRHSEVLVPHKNKKDVVKKPHRCDIDGCHMSFMTKAELQLHKRNLCPHKGCGKKFSSHKYAIIHQRVHDDKRPLKCPWKGCSMSFKWGWARTEHVRLHTGEKPYQCKVEGCGLSFRYVSDFSRHRRKTGHYVNSPA